LRQPFVEEMLRRSQDPTEHDKPFTHAARRKRNTPPSVQTADCCLTVLQHVFVLHDATSSYEFLFFSETSSDVFDCGILFCAKELGSSPS
jgi:hypothetical protein